MLMIRLRRGGAKHNPVYRVVVSDSRKDTQADYLEQVGFYDPNPDPPEILGKDPVGDRLAVDQHAVTVEDDGAHD